MTGSSDACIAQTKCANARGCPKAGEIWQFYTPLNTVLGYQHTSVYLPPQTWTPTQTQQTALSKSMRISAVCADRTTQWIHLKCTSIDIASRINWDGKAEARIPNVRAETAPKQGKQIPHFQSWARQKVICSPIPTCNLQRSGIFLVH